MSLFHTQVSAERVILDLHDSHDPRDLVVAAAALADPRDLRAVAVKMGPDRVTLGATDGDDQPLTQTPTVEGRFPPINDIMPKKFGVGLAVVNIDPALFAETLGSKPSPRLAPGFQ